MTGWSVAP
jgi:hypothetical protein